MCYDIKHMKASMLKKAKYFGDKEQIEKLEEEIKQLNLFDFHHVSGFQHPQIVIFTNDSEAPFKVAHWGLIPSWTKDLESGKRFWNKTLNARSETIFEKNSFRESAKNKRCLIVVDGFFEHHHKNGRTFPYYIHTKEPIILAGIWNNWKRNGEEIRTFSIVTTKANPFMSSIHNNPKMDEPRMPVILNNELGKRYLEIDATDKAGMDEILELCKTIDVDLEAHTVHPIRGKNSIGNRLEATEEHIYIDLL